MITRSLLKPHHIDGFGIQTLPIIRHVLQLSVWVPLKANLTLHQHSRLTIDHALLQSCEIEHQRQPKWRSKVLHPFDGCAVQADLGGAPVRTGSQHRLASVGRLVGWLDCWSAAPGLAPGLAPAVWLTPGGTGIGTGCIGRSRLAPGLAPAGIASAGIGCIGRSHAHTRAPACTAARPPARPHSRSRR